MQWSCVLMLSHLILSTLWYINYSPHVTDEGQKGLKLVQCHTTGKCQNPNVNPGLSYSIAPPISPKGSLPSHALVLPNCPSDSHPISQSPLQMPLPPWSHLSSTHLRHFDSKHFCFDYSYLLYYYGLCVLFTQLRSLAVGGHGCIWLAFGASEQEHLVQSLEHSECSVNVGYTELERSVNLNYNSIWYQMQSKCFHQWLITSDTSLGSFPSFAMCVPKWDREKTEFLK